MIELRHINYFVVASEQGSFRKAATLLSIQASAVSRRIRDLEDQLGASLFGCNNKVIDVAQLDHKGPPFAGIFDLRATSSSNHYT